MLNRLEDDTYVYRWKINHYYPFQDEDEWELGKFMVENLTQTQMIEFLRLKWFNSPREKPSFTMKDQLLDWMDSLPCFMEWKASKMEFSGYKTIHPIKLIWHDALEVVKQLFSDPTFANHMTYTPHDHLPVGATQVLIILGSDKTHVTQITGGLEMHPVFLTISNIDSDIRSKATLRAWQCIAYMPIAKFHVHPDYQSILQVWLWHKCMDLILANLKATALDGCFMPDPSRYICYVFTPLIAHVCDLPEASMIAAVTKNASPLTMAVQGDFGNGTLHPPRTGKHTLQCIVNISCKVDPWDLDKFQKAAKAVNLSGVHMPYWRDWIYTCPSISLASEILHTCFNFFADHPLQWTKEAVGAHKLDNHFIVQHKRVGTRHFTKGVTHVKQMTGHEYREIQCTIVALIAGTASPQFVHAIRAIVEFIYLAQNSVHSPETLQSMEQALSDFHVCKGAIIEAEARKGKKGVKEDFFIPKLELLQSFKGTVQRLGTLMQFSADTTEHLLITHCKDLFSQTARQSKNFTEQCESMEIFDLYMLLSSHGVSLVNAMHAEEEEVAITNPALIQGILSGDAQTTFQVNITPDYKSLSLAEICIKYALPDFDRSLVDFVAWSSLSSGKHTRWDPKYGRYQVWNKFQLQLHSAFQQRVIMPSRVVQAYPPSNDFPLGNCNTVLTDTMGINGKMTSYITQVRVIFQPVVQRGSNLELPSYLSDPLLYVQFFRFISSPDEHPKLAMWTVEHAYMQDQNGNQYREGAAIRVVDVMHAVELIPVYGEAVADGMSSAICLEHYECFFLNNFADKESYHAFSTEFV
ncbi:uncharacterized protein BJ212DRAFT_1449522 [Suillus subaureus]|uniref:DUF6830 domain-containing protein n=1 Tax=Suillus subaureus TaxID=48587 RepID=A0A9P7DXG2_9AGAM|nr:uncharacterized protein BJ212DRAFT_1449522 [Suillus subaureus]KAG1805845.1 hypothetical protein BJ212DRAFT_1449522 [Suillus subaureus]